MCTYSFTFNDSSVDRIRPSFKDETDMQRWMQQQMETIILQYAMTLPKKNTPKNHRHSLSHLRGILDTEETDAQLLAETINEKYGL